MSSPIEPIRTALARGPRRGTATVEAVVALPTLVLLFIAVFFVRDLTTAKHEALIAARTCAWLYSMNNCSQKPPGCEAILSDASLVDFHSDDLEQKTESLGEDSVGSLVHGILKPVLDAAFGKSTVADVRRPVSRPALFGGNTTSVPGTYHLACNVSETTLASVAKDAWHAFFPAFSPL